MPENNGHHKDMVDARPTKEFFISMLTKDIELTRSIIDLVDNSVDGARNLSGRGQYGGLFIKIEANDKYFTVADNCGGIEIGIARDYAFRFGRPAKMKPTTHSVGQFGVGMKRALFKIGKHFHIRSDAPRSWFVLDVDVEDWKASEEWEFKFEDYRENLAVDKNREVGTTIKVDSLHPAVSEAFSSEIFQTRLAREISEAHSQTIAAGLSITLGGVPLAVRPLALLQSNELKPAFYEMSWGKGKSAVKVRLYAGVAESKPSEAGWNVYCNGRLVLGADQSNKTGWGEGGGKVIPFFHPQFTRFRGYAFLDSDDAGALPWNTTKTGVDIDSPQYKAVRLEMIKLTRPIIDFLNKLAAERKSADEEDRMLEAAIASAKTQDVTAITAHRPFRAPQYLERKVQAPELVRISYVRPKIELNLVKRKLKVSSAKAVGEKTFEYFFKRECE